MASGPERLGYWWDERAFGLEGRGLLLSTAITNLSLVAAFTLALLVAAFAIFPLGPGFIIVTLVTLATIFALVLRALPGHGHDRFGPANLVTSIRAGLVSLTAGALVSSERLAGDPMALWALLGIVLIAFALDGIDGYLARRFEVESSFGARFDMEVDAFLILLLSLAALLLDKVGAWVVLIGLMRYGFLAWGRFSPKLNGSLPPSFRRKLVCVVQVAALCAILVPFVSSDVATAIAAIALAALVYSFAVDIRYLLARPGVER